MSTPWKREVNIGACRLLLGDCREILPTLGRVDAVVTDPPYGVGYSHDGGGLKRIPGRTVLCRRAAAPIVGDDGPFDPAPLLDYPEVITWGADHYFARLPDGGRWLAWDKKAGWSFEDNFGDVEFAWHSEDGAARIINYLWKGVRQDGEKGLPKYHPMQKPIAVMEWCIGQLRGAPETILDPYMGSGGTGVACVRLGKGFVGIEIEERFFDIACRRIETATRQPDLFIEPPSPPVQLSLMEAAE